MGKIVSMVVREIREAIPAAIFFFLAFHLVALTKTLILKDYGITPGGMAIATIGALIVAKAILIADKLPVTGLFRNKPLVYGIIWKAIIYGVIVVLFRYVEELIPMLFRHSSLSSANRHLIEELSWPHFWALQIWLQVSLLSFCAATELIRTFGSSKMKEIFFGWRPGSSSRSS
jgi:hypothetical protein